MNRTKAGCRLAAAAVVGVALNVQADSHEFREHDAHEHGHGELDLVVDGNEMVIELRVPGVNVVGFEHEATTDAQRQAVNEALETFGHAETLFVPSSAARCKVEEVEVALGDVEHHEDEHGHDDDHKDEHAHEDDHKDEHAHKDDHEDEHEHEAHEEEEAHNELHGTYHFHCDLPAALARVEVRVFEHLRDADELEARVVTPNVQTAVELEPGNAVISLAP